MSLTKRFNCRFRHEKKDPRECTLKKLAVRLALFFGSENFVFLIFFGFEKYSVIFFGVINFRFNCLG